MNSSTAAPTPAPSPASAPARFFDGRTARPHLVHVWFLPGLELAIQGERVEHRCRAQDVQLDPRLENTPRFLHLADRQTCEFTDLAALEHALAAWPEAARFHRRAPGLRAATVALVFLAVGTWLAITQALPAAARTLATALPANIVHNLGRNALADLDDSVFEPSRIPQARQNELRAKARAFLAAAGESPDLAVEFRAAPQIGANAMALPSGEIVLTDDLVRLAQHDEQILAVLAHEAGHLHHRHSLRQILQGSAVAITVALAAGKDTADSLHGKLASNLLNSRYSRDFEYEADAFAVTVLQRAGIPPARLGEMLDLLEQQQKTRSRQTGVLDSYLGTHPTTPERKRHLVAP